MADLHNCPTREQLTSVLAGALAEQDQESITVHIESCEQCQQTLEQLAATSWDERAKALAHESSQHGEALRKVMADAEEDLTQAEYRTPSANPDDDFSFLTPSENPNHLGRFHHYEIIRLLGKGGFGYVFKAFDETLDRTVALKMLAPQLAVNATARRRFEREAKAAAAVSHDHVVTIHAVEGGDIPYLVMECVVGRSLEQRLRDDGPLEVREILRIGNQIARGLTAAHKQGLVHRDIKPANILLENGVERVKITDFGLARAIDDASLTQSGVITGTPMYMSPEQARGESLDHRADLFSLGSVLYAMCTGRPPFRASGVMAVLKRVCDDAPRPIHEIQPDIPNWLCDIVAKLQAKNPDDRFQSAEEIADLLEQHLAHLQKPKVAPKPKAVEAPEAPPSSRPRRVLSRTLYLSLAILCAVGIPATFIYVQGVGLHAREGMRWRLFEEWTPFVAVLLGFASFFAFEWFFEAKPARSKTRQEKKWIRRVPTVIAFLILLAIVFVAILDGTQQMDGRRAEELGAILYIDAAIYLFSFAIVSLILRRMNNPHARPFPSAAGWVLLIFFAGVTLIFIGWVGEPWDEFERVWVRYYLRPQPYLQVRVEDPSLIVKVERKSNGKWEGRYIWSQGVGRTKQAFDPGFYTLAVWQKGVPIHSHAFRLRHGDTISWNDRSILTTLKITAEDSEYFKNRSVKIYRRIWKVTNPGVGTIAWEPVQIFDKPGQSKILPGKYKFDEFLGNELVSSKKITLRANQPYELNYSGHSADVAEGMIAFDAKPDYFKGRKVVLKIYREIRRQTGPNAKNDKGVVFLVRTITGPLNVKMKFPPGHYALKEYHDGKLATTERLTLTRGSTSTFTYGRKDVGRKSLLFKTETGETVIMPRGKISWADRVDSFQVGKRVETPKESTLAIGAPDRKWVGLGDGGVLIVEFTDNVLIDGPGNDLVVFESGGKPIDPFAVAISEDGKKWIEVAHVKKPPFTLDIGKVAKPDQRFRFVKITDMGAKVWRFAGAYIDAVGAIHTLPVVAPRKRGGRPESKNNQSEK